jgi:hypothetical protein
MESTTFILLLILLIALTLINMVMLAAIGSFLYRLGTHLRSEGEQPPMPQVERRANEAGLIEP